MRKIGIVGGLSPESTVEYYRYITRTYTERYGNYAYPPVLIYGVSFQPFRDWPVQERWDLVAQGLIEAARSLEADGADVILIAANTMHLVFDQVRAAVKVPMLSLLDAVGDAILARGMRTVGLLGTRFTMEKSFYKDALAHKGITTLVPEAADREVINRVIYGELDRGLLLEASRKAYVAIIQKLRAQGAEGIVLGCTEIPLLISEKDAGMSVFDSTTIHAEAALSYAIKP